MHNASLMHPSAACNIYPMKVEPHSMKVESDQVMPSAQIKSELPQPPVSDSKPVFTVDISTMHCKLHGTSSHDADRSVPLEPGPHGLLIAKFGEMVHTTELSNLMLAVPPPPKKRPAAAPVAKKPAAHMEAADLAAAPPAAHPAAAEAPAAPLGAEAPAAHEAVAKDDYSVMWYKNGRWIGIREKFGMKSQVVSYGGKKSLRTEKELRDYAKVLVADLNAGEGVAATRRKGRAFAFPGE